jgi:hypothetical protein
MDALDSTTAERTTKRWCWNRREIADRYEQAQRLNRPGCSQARISRQIGVPRTTLQHWRKRRKQLERDGKLSPAVVSFFESPDGLAFLHRLLTAVHLVFGQAHDGGVRGMGWFLELSLLDRFAAASYGAQQDRASEMERLLAQFGAEEDHRLAEQMPAREITLCEDETFHPQICLVAIEPVSNFLVLEEYAERRDAETWHSAVAEALQPLSVTVIQCVSDEARALITHAETHLGAHHAPDIFHVQYETSQATSLALNRHTEQAQSQLDAAESAREQCGVELAACREQCPVSSHGFALEQQCAAAEHNAVVARERRDQCQDRQHRARTARRGLSRDYHPFDLDTGQRLEAADVERRFTQHFDTLTQIAVEANLSPAARDRLTKARRVQRSLVATLTFFWSMITIRLARLPGSLEVARVWRDELVAGHYLARAAGRADTADERRRLHALSEIILARARSPTSPLAALPEADREGLEQQARDAADIFQRSSSCVEGRNGQLSLRHHGLRELTPCKLRALRVLHNYAARRADGTTAAERFFGQHPRELFPWLLDRLSLPARPRRRA